MLKTIVRSFSSSILTIVIGFFLSVILARALGPESRGEVGSIMMIVVLVAGISQFGLGESYVYFRRKYYSNGGLVVFFLSSLTFVFLFSLSITYAGIFFSSSINMYIYC
jgi:O-antigen/teichoic acid export membrane protein